MPFRPFTWLAKRLEHARLSVTEDDNTFTVGAGAWEASPRDRYSSDRREVLQEALNAWRLNPLGRRIVELTTQYVVGGGVELDCRQPAAAEFLRTFWEHPLNRMALRIYEWCDELTRTGNLFILLATDAAGMSYVRAIPAQQVERIEARPNDIEQPLAFCLLAGLESGPRDLPAYDPQNDGRAADGGFPPVGLHYAINRPPGAQWGESDLAPVLKWLSRYGNWLEDRARLNRFRNSFAYVVRGAFGSEEERAARQAALAAHPPSSGSILVIDESESWSVISPQLESADASTDGLALKKMIASGVGLPLHFLAEPESATRTTAEAAGGPTYRHFEQRQRLFLWLLEDLLRAVLQRRAQVDPGLDPAAALDLHGADLSSKDNASMATALGQVMDALTGLRDRQLIDDAELLRLAYRFAGEVVDVEAMLRRARRESGR
jgi:hypothetical protein